MSPDKMRKCDRDPLKKSSPDIRPADAPRLPKTKKVKLGTRTVTLYSIGWIASLSNKDPHTIRRYEWRQLIPSPLLETKDKQRWYLAEEVAGYSNAIKNTKVRPGRNIEHTDLRDRCWAYRDKVKEKMKQSLELLADKLSNEQEVWDYQVLMRKAVSAHRIQTKFAARLLK